MKSAFGNVNFIVFDLIDDSVFLINSSRPKTLVFVLKGLGFP